MPRKKVDGKPLDRTNYRICPGCGINKVHEEYPRYQKISGGKYYLRKKCKVCWKEQRAPQRENYRLHNIEYIAEYQRKSYLKNKTKHATATKRNYEYLKKQVFDHYGAICDCCGETEISFLSIDHINNDGAEHRRNIAPGATFFNWIIRNGFPKSLRILCMNCNTGRQRNGGVCPHEERYADIVPIGFKQKEG